MLNLHYDENGRRTGELYLNMPWRFKRLAAKPFSVSILPSMAEGRNEAEDFIKKVYKDSYGAKIEVHYPVIMSVRDESGKILAATGFRFAKDEPLFLEQYLGQAVENVLHIPRCKIVEIGNLASRGGGASLYLFMALAAYLEYQGYSHAVVTSTHFLEKRFHQMGLHPVRHTAADPLCLKNSQEDWGTYYETTPFVLSGSISDGFKKLQKQTGAIYKDLRPRLYPRLHYKEC